MGLCNGTCSSDTRASSSCTPDRQFHNTNVNLRPRRAPVAELIPRKLPVVKLRPLYFTNRPACLRRSRYFPVVCRRGTFLIVSLFLLLFSLTRGIAQRRTLLLNVCYRRTRISIPPHPLIMRPGEKPAFSMKITLELELELRESKSCLNLNEQRDAFISCARENIPSA